MVEKKEQNVARRPRKAVHMQSRNIFLMHIECREHWYCKTKMIEKEDSEDPGGSEISE